MAATQRRITEAAIELHATVGPSRTTLGAVAERAGVERRITFLPLSRGGAANGMRAFKVHYPAEDRDPAPTVHDGHDWIYVLSGRLRLVLGDDDFVLEPGEAAEFSCRTPHWLGAVGGPAEALAIFGPQGERIHTR